MTQQEQFEAWLSINTPCCSEYNRQQIEWLMWQAWQASRAAIVVKLPNSFHDKYEQYVYDCASLELSLDEAGVGYE